MLGMNFIDKAVLYIKSTPSKTATYTYTKIYIDCRLNMKQVQYRNTEGLIVLSKATIYTNYTDIKIGDKIEYDSITYVVDGKDVCKSIFGDTGYAKCYLI